MFGANYFCEAFRNARNAAVGGPAAMEEARLMVSEKSEAALRYGPPLMAGGSLEHMVDDYRGIVQANALRLSGK